MGEYKPGHRLLINGSYVDHPEDYTPDPRVMATCHPASQDRVQYVLNLPVNDADLNSFDGRSPWYWVRFPNGDLMLGTFPQGDAYFDCEVDADYLGPLSYEDQQGIGDAADLPDSLAQVIGRKVVGIDCTQDESAEIMAYFDRLAGRGHRDTMIARVEKNAVSGFFPLEFDQWVGELDQGLRP